MRRASLLASTPLRLALLFASLFLGAFLLSGVAAYQYLKTEISLRDDRLIKENFDVYSASFFKDGIDDLTEHIKLQIAAAGDGENIYLLQDPGGKVLAGNVKSMPAHPGWSDFGGTELGLDSDLSFRMFEGAFSGYRLVLGVNNEDAASLEEIALTSFGWASLVSLALAIGGAALIASRARQRYDAVRNSIDLIGQGDLSARIPLIGRGDDIDLLSGDINAALERLSHLVEGMRQVSADMAHELKTPLNRLKINLQAAMEKQAKGLRASKELNAANDEADNINATFAALLRIAQIESGARKSRFAKLDIGDVLADVAEVYSEVAEDAGQTLIFQNMEQPAPVNGDRELLVQMFANLIENSIRHCPKGAAISVELSAAPDRVSVIVADDGPGIPEAERGKVLRRLYRLEKSRSSPGTGLGLSLVRAIADLHEAQLSLDDNHPGLKVSAIFPG